MGWSCFVRVVLLGSRRCIGRIALILCLQIFCTHIGFAESLPVSELEEELQIVMLDSEGMVRWLGDMRESGVLASLARASETDQMGSWLGLMGRSDLMESITMMEDKQPLRDWLKVMTNPALLYGMMGKDSSIVFGPWLHRMMDPMLISSILYSEEIAMMDAWSGSLGNQRYLRSMMEEMSPGAMQEITESMQSSMEMMMAAFGAGAEHGEETGAP